MKLAKNQSGFITILPDDLKRIGKNFLYICIHLLLLRLIYHFVVAFFKNWQAEIFHLFMKESNHPIIIFE